MNKSLGYILLIIITFAVTGWFHNFKTKQWEAKESEYLNAIKSYERKQDAHLDSILVLRNDYEKIKVKLERSDSMYNAAVSDFRKYKTDREKFYNDILNNSSSDDILKLFSELGS